MHQMNSKHISMGSDTMLGIWNHNIVVVLVSLKVYGSFLGGFGEYLRDPILVQTKLASIPSSPL